MRPLSVQREHGVGFVVVIAPHGEGGVAMDACVALPDMTPERQELPPREMYSPPDLRYMVPQVNQPRGRRWDSQNDIGHEMTTAFSQI
jgi:hypothetical protein